MVGSILRWMTWISGSTASAKRKPRRKRIYLRQLVRGFSSLYMGMKRKALDKKITMQVCQVGNYFFLFLIFDGCLATGWLSFKSIVSVAYNQLLYRTFIFLRWVCWSLQGLKTTLFQCIQQLIRFSNYFSRNSQFSHLKIRFFFRHSEIFPVKEFFQRSLLISFKHSGFFSGTQNFF